MATFGSITRGPRARKRIKLPLPGATTNAETGEWEGDVVELDVCGLGPLEQTEVARNARTFAQAQGLESPKDGDDLYDWGKTLYTLVLTCLDKDSPENDPKPFFDGGFDQLHKTKILAPEHIGYLYEQQQRWQDECAPGRDKLTEGEFFDALVKTARGDMSFFVSARPSLQWSFTHTLAARLRAWLTQKSPSSSLSEPSTATTET